MEANEFEAVYRRLYPFVARTAYLIVLDWSIAQEISQEAFGRLWQHRRNLLGLGDPKAWLLRVAVNLAIDHRRTMLAALRHRFALEPPPDAAELAVRQMQAGEMRSALLRLPTRDRALLALRFEHGLSFPQIGEVFDKPEATVKTWLHRALHQLRLILGEAPGAVRLTEGQS